MTDAETATLAEYLRADLEKIARSANDELKLVKRSGLPDFARQAEEARIIDEARARAVQRVESTVRHLRTAAPAGASTQRPAARAGTPVMGPDLGMTQVIPAVRAEAPRLDVRADVASERRWRVAEHARDSAEQEAGDGHGVPEAGDPPPIDDTQVIPAVTEVPPASGGQAGGVSERRRQVPEPEAVARHRRLDAAPAPASVALQPSAGEETGIDRLNRLLEFVVRQEPRLNWAVADHADGTTVVVTDLAHGWIPPGITLPGGVRLLDPGRRSGKASALTGETTRVATYAPGDSLRRSADLATTKASLQPRELPAVDDLGAELSTATHRRDGLPRMVHAMATVAAGGTRIVDQEVDVLRVHLDTARYQLLAQYPSVDSALLLNCLLLAATEAFVAGDSVSANYHLAWFRELAAPSSS